MGVTLLSVLKWTLENHPLYKEGKSLAKPHQRHDQIWIILPQRNIDILIGMLDHTSYIIPQ